MHSNTSNISKENKDRTRTRWNRAQTAKYAHQKFKQKNKE